MADWRSTRASGTDRERAADLLRTAHGDGRLAWPEYSARFERLMSSTTHGEIHQVVVDLIAESARQDTNGDPAADRDHTRSRYGNGAEPRTRGSRPGNGNRPGNGGRASVDRLASAAMLCGALVPFTIGISGIPAILLGHLVRRRLKQAPEHRATGNSAQMATAALVLGYLPIVAGIAVLAFLLTR